MRIKFFVSTCSKIKGTRRNILLIKAVKVMIINKYKSGNKTLLYSERL